MYPLLRPAQADSLRRQLWRTPLSPARVELLLRLGNDRIVKYDQLNEALDSAASYCQQAAALSQQLGYGNGQICSQYALGNLDVALGQVPAGHRRLAQALARSRQAHYPRLEADGWYYLASAYTFTVADMPRRIECLQHAQALYQTLGDGEQAAYVLKTIADIHMQQGQEALARTELLDVLARYRAVGYHHLHYTYDLLDAVTAKAGNFKEALGYGLAAIESAKATGDTAKLNFFYHRIGNIYNMLNQPADALHVYQKVLSSLERKHDSTNVIIVSEMVAKMLIKLQQPRQALAFVLEKTSAYPLARNEQFYAWNLLSTCYLINQQYGLAEMYALKSIKSLESRQKIANSYSQLGAAYFTAGRIYLAMRHCEESRLYLNKALALHSQISLSVKSDVYRLLFKVDSTQGRYLAAIGHQQRYQALNDSLFNEKKSKQIASLQVQYETRQKEQDMALLTKQSLVQQANLRQREGQRNALLAGVAMLAMLLALGYNRYRLKQRSNRLLEAQRQEISAQNQLLEQVLTEKSGLLEDKEWMLKEIHHRVKNNLQVIGSLLRSQSVYLPAGAARTAIRESRNRVHAMALIHQKLYQSEHLAGVPMAAYIQEIVDHLLASFDCPPGIRVELAVAPVQLDVALAVPVGLILNEAVTNALKYAFPNGRGGHLFVGFAAPTADCYQFSICDDGVGFEADFEPTQSRTLGLSLIEGLSKQLGGCLRVAGGCGVRIVLDFSAPALLVRGH
ncbi:sensor histidine kinase [Hymenobacter sp. H14-R3]|uniref:tetratricopeptide repeat-containing sensor histidine kinase n=1 Tax=Hymenobacter sp. H14-R3 TaxID=3046308 RepID=UPI0024BB69D9|nr:sensor histidine kinase [Hymenobacter sp. H14-R3]MDJ0367700.1 sensor histidine kinase [Hymenobacter sp. H14-R3]